MSSQQQLTNSPALTGQAGCVVCGGTVEGSRCDQCGVAVAPGGWRILRQIAKGPHSRVFLAEKTGQQVALKELLFALVPEASQLDGFEREARLLAQLKHPSIPSLVEFFREGQAIHTRLYLAQEFVRGRSLLEQLDGHRFDEKEIRALARELLGILEYLHGLSPRVIHRDLKPANVMRREDGSLALVDFGSARDLVKGVTHGSTLVGTFGYMPPEQLGGTVDLTADLYALGATLLHLLSRKPPDELLKPGMELAFDGEVNASEGFRGWLHQLVQRERGARFQSARAALAALDALDRPVREKPPASAGLATNVRLALGVGGALLAAISVLIGVLGEGQKPHPPVRELPITYEAPVRSVAPPRPPVRSVAPLTPPVVVPPHSEVVTVPKLKALAPFTLDSELQFDLEFRIPFTNPDPTCATTPGELSIASLRAVPSTPALLTMSTAITSFGGAPLCSNVFVELLDQNGQRAMATLLSHPKAPGAIQQAQLKLPLPANSRKVQLRLGPQARPYAVVDVDLVTGKAIQR